ncbi:MULTISPECIES: sensor histidine kinase [Streptomyces]|uniref:GAF domain-containing protein n=1 Tax=Streptomyces antimycoticus TaxID=68175 RepID=A0ABD5J6R4_9ACTN|nr:MULTISPECIES: GAF domain-containing protein [Streptomyces]MEE4584060.1 GAF domain-containing protein [Streptomyces sp. DSM 41602]WTA82513.1 GAF domain-containing sensor histidine kinase [Streptomyces antimycoticus]WTB06960.1 GAF domain-containing sensor histidine kinase [Streptomyces antimycoticus]
MINTRWTPTRRRRSATALAEVTQHILAGETADATLRLIARRVRELLGADMARVMVLEPGDVLTIRATDGAPWTAPSGPLTPGGSSPARQAIRAGRPTVSSHERRPRRLGRDPRQAVPASVLDAPLLVRGHPVGVIEVANRGGGRRLSHADVSTVGRFAAPAAHAVAQIRHREHLRRLASAAAGPGSAGSAGSSGSSGLPEPSGSAWGSSGSSAFTRSSGPCVRRTLDSLAAGAVARTGAASCTVYLLEPGPSANLRLVGGGHGHTPPSRKPALEAIAGAAPVIHGGGRTGTDGDGPARGAVAAWPLLRESTAIGAMCCHFPPGRDPGEADITLLEVIAGHASCAVENDRQQGATQERSVREERQRISRELHDSVSQALYGIALGARTAREMLERDIDSAEPVGRAETQSPGEGAVWVNPAAGHEAVGEVVDLAELAELAEPIEYIRRLADAAIAETRTLLCRLRPESLETEGLVAALAQHVEALRARYGITTEAKLDTEPETTPEAKHALYRIAQESLHNIAKHSQARNVRLHLLNEPGAVTLTVADDGVGFDCKGSFPGHLGLLSMRERAREVGGTLNVDSRPGQGSRIRARVPATKDS